jgi:hypothetical protein
LTYAQNLNTILTPRGELTPEAERALRQRQEFKTLTAEEIELGKAELERREQESRLEKRERIEKQKEEEKEAEKAEELSNQEKELRYIFNKYKDRTLRNIDLLIRSFIEDQFVKNNIDATLETITELDFERLDPALFERDLNTMDYGLIDVFDKYQEEVINDVVHRFQLRSAFYRDAAKKMRDTFAEAKKEAMAQITSHLLTQIRNGQLPFTRKPVGSTKTTSVPPAKASGLTEAQAAVSENPLEMIFQDFIDRVVKEILDNFTLRWAVKDIFRPVEEELPYAKLVEELKLFGHEIFSRPPATFAPPTSMPVTEDYLIGPGDEIKV